jgi:hypothetical protein
MLFKFDSHPSPGLYKNGRLVTAEYATTARFNSLSKSRTASASMGGGGIGGGGAEFGGFAPGGGSYGGNMSTADVEMYNPVRDRLDEGSVVEDWLPRDASGLDEMFRLMYHRDHIAGTIVDMIADTIWSDYDLVGIKDPVVKNLFQDSMEAINIIATMPDITREFLVLGRTISSLIFDKNRGIFKDIISHDPSLVRLTPIPIKGYDPKIDLIPSPALRRFVDSVDPRDVDARQALPEAFINAVKQASGGSGGRFSSLQTSMYAGQTGAGGIPLDPVNTLFVGRRVFNYDYIGTSFYTRLITFWALEKALINATVTSARRRSRSILHVKAGIDNMWEPSANELDNIGGMFIQADQDPVGAVVTTRTGVDASEVRSGSDFYKWGDEWGLLNEGKLRALGANDGLLSGDATYSNQESARMFFMERAANLRRSLTSRIFYDRLFPLLARIHGLKKVTTAELNHNIRIKRYGVQGNRLTQRQALEIPDSELMYPTIQWRKELVSDIDEKRLDIYERLEEKGLPVSLKSWAAAGNVDLDSMTSDMEADADIRRQVSRWRKSYEDEVNFAEEEAKLEFVRSLQQLAHSHVKQALASTGQKTDVMGPISLYPFWSREGTIGSLHAGDLAVFLKRFEPSSNAIEMLADYEALKTALFQTFKKECEADVAHYLMFRTRLTPLAPVLSTASVVSLSNHIKNVLDQHAGNGNVYQLALAAQGELEMVAKLAVKKEPKSESKVSSSSSYDKLPKIDKVEKNIKAQIGTLGRNFDAIPASSLKLYSGKDIKK